MTTSLLRQPSRQGTFALAAAALFIASDGLESRYDVGRAVRVEAETRIALETTAFDMERDGEPVESPFDPIGQRMVDERTIVVVDRVLEAAEGAPTRLRRSFESVTASNLVPAPDGERTIERECPLDGVTVELALEDGDVRASVVEGDEPDDATLLEGHHLTLALDALLPSTGVEVGASWELDADAIRIALGFDLEEKLFPRPQRPDRPEGGGEGGGRRGGPRGGAQGGLSGVLRDADWKGTATLKALDHQEEGVEGACALIELELSCDGDLPEPQFGGGRGGRERSAAPPSAPGAVAGTFEVELKGHLAYSKGLGLPVALELEGRIETEQTMERSRGESSMRMHTEQSGDIRHVVRVTLESASDESAAEKNTGDE